MVRSVGRWCEALGDGEERWVMVRSGEGRLWISIRTPSVVLIVRPDIRIAFASAQVDQLMSWFVKQHAAGVTVRGGKLPAQKQQQNMRSTGDKHVQIMDRMSGAMPKPNVQSHLGSAPSTAPPAHSPTPVPFGYIPPYKGSSSP